MEAQKALYDEYDRTYSAQQETDEQRARADSLEAELAQEKAKTAFVKKVGLSLLADFYRVQDECDALKVRLLLLSALCLQTLTLTSGTAERDPFYHSYSY